MTQLSSRGALLVVLLLTELLYLPSLYADFVSYDDAAYVTRNADVPQPELTRIFDVGHTTLSDWTPVVTLSHAAEYALFGHRAFGYHVINLLLHIISIALVYLLLRDCGVPAFECAAAALVFACHPLQVESVAWISARKNLLAAVLGLAFMLSFLKAKPLLGLIFLLLAFGSKGTAVVFPCWAAVAVFLGFGRLPLRRATPWLILFLALAVSRGVASAVLQGQVASVLGPGEMSLGQRMAVMGPVFATQLRQFFLPYGLSLRYDTLPPNWSDPRVLGSWGVVALIVLLVVWWAQRDRYVALAGCFVGIAVLPTAQIVPAPYFQADRYTHLALVGGALLGVRLLRPLERVQWWLPGAVLALWCALVLVPLTHLRIGVWYSSKTLGEDTARRTRQSGLGWQLVANYYLDRRQTDQAEAALWQVLAIEPDSVQAHYNLALLSLNQDRLSEAGAHAETLLRLDRSVSPDHYCLFGRILLAQQRPAESLPYFNTALQIFPEMPVARYGRAMAYMHLGQLDAAESDLQALIAPGHEDANLLAMLATIRLRQDRAREAAELARRATESDPRAGTAWDALGQALLALGDVDGAEGALQTGISAMPNFADLRYHLAQLHERRGDHEVARMAASEALRLLRTTQPDWAADARRLAQ